QAEDGIRDRNVTGVQTCALPICFSVLWRRSVSAAEGFQREIEAALAVGTRAREPDIPGAPGNLARLLDLLFRWIDDRHAQLGQRSEERRVGKECRAGGWACE